MTNKKSDKKSRISITIDANVFNDAKIACAKTGRKLSSLIQILLERELKNSA